MRCSSHTKGSHEEAPADLTALHGTKWETMMSRRYDLKIGDENEETEMVERQNGDWVMADDYIELAHERDELRLIISDAIDRLRDA